MLDPQTLTWLIPVPPLLAFFLMDPGPPAPFDIAITALLAVVWTLTVMRTGLVTGVALLAVWVLAYAAMGAFA